MLGTIFLIFWQLHHYDTVNILMLRHCVISLPRTERHRENAEKFAFLSAAMSEYYSYFTEVFCKCFNACAHLN